MVFGRVRESLERGEVDRLKQTIQMAMKAGQMSCTVCRLTAKRDYDYQGARAFNGEAKQTRHKSLRAVERSTVELRRGAFWELKEPWDWLITWLKTDQGLEYDLSFHVISTDPYGEHVEADYADLVVSWPPYTGDEQGRVRGKLMRFWEDVCLPKTVRVEDGREKWKQLFKNAMACGQDTAVIQTLYHGQDFSLVPGEELDRHTPELICRTGARSWLSNAPLPAGAVEGGARYVLEKRLLPMVNWIVDTQKLRWYLVLEVEVNPNKELSIIAERQRTLRALFQSHIGKDAGEVVSLDEVEKFILKAARMKPPPLRYRMSKWAYLVVTDAPLPTIV